MARKAKKKEPEPTYIVLDTVEEVGLLCYGKEHTTEQINHLVEMGTALNDIRVFEGSEVEVKTKVFVSIGERLD